MIGRINVSADPIRRFNECEDFFKLIINCFLLVAAMKFLKMISLSDVHSLSFHMLTKQMSYGWNQLRSEVLFFHLCVKALLKNSFHLSLTILNHVQMIRY